MSRVMRKPVQHKPDCMDTEGDILDLEGLYLLCSENKGADQLRGYHVTDLRFCFQICKRLVFS